VIDPRPAGPPDADALVACLHIEQLSALGAGALSPMARAYYSGGARDGRTLVANREAFARTFLRPRCLRGVGQRSAASTLLGAPLRAPILLAPTAFLGLAHPEGERATARAARAAGTVMVCSTLATTPIEAVCAAAGVGAPEHTGTVWFQLYIYKDRGLTEALIDRAKAAGCTALVVTADAPVLGAREGDAVHRFGLPPQLRVENVVPEGYGALPSEAQGSGLAAYVYRLLDPDLRTADVERLAARAGLPVLVKGVLRGDDAAACVESGAAGVIVSNHGGRQLDGAVPALLALPEVVDAVAGRAPVLLDSGVRRGSDVLKALALGAQAALIGRPAVFALAAGGQAGVERALHLLRAELDEAMALCGCGRLSDIDRGLIAGLPRPEALSGAAATP
jgi:4-hydroxymandelate oxidase